MLIQNGLLRLIPITRLLASAYAAPTHNAQCLNLENHGLSPGCTQERERDETLGEAKLIFKLEKRYTMTITIY